jgi:hypothetical protein
MRKLVIPALLVGDACAGGSTHDTESGDLSTGTVLLRRFAVNGLLRRFARDFSAFHG